MSIRRLSVLVVASLIIAACMSPQRGLELARQQAMAEGIAHCQSEGKTFRPTNTELVFGAGVFDRGRAIIRGVCLP